MTIKYTSIHNPHHNNVNQNTHQQKEPEHLMSVQNFVETLAIWQVVMSNLCNSCHCARSADDQIVRFSSTGVSCKLEKSNRNVQWLQLQWSTPWSLLGSFGEVCSTTKHQITTTLLALLGQTSGKFCYLRKHQRKWKFLVLDTIICIFTVTWEIFGESFIYKMN